MNSRNNYVPFTEQESFPENYLLTKGNKKDTRTCSLHDDYNDEIVEKGKKREKSHLLHNAINESYDSDRRCDVLDNENSSKQLTFCSGIESTYSSIHQPTYKRKLSAFCENIENGNGISGHLTYNNPEEFKQKDLFEVPCPVCHNAIPIENSSNLDFIVNTHVDICLNSSTISDLACKSPRKNLVRENFDFESSGQARRQTEPNSEKLSGSAVKRKVQQVNSILKYMVPKN